MRKNQGREPEQFFIGDRKSGDAPPPRIQPTGKLIKEKTELKKSAGVSQQVTVPDHQEKLTKHGLKPVVVATKEEDKPTPHVPKQSDVSYAQGAKQKGAPPPPKRTILRKRPAEAGPPTKKNRRVSAHEI